MASTGLLGINPYRGGNVAIDFTSKPLQTFLQIKQRKDAQAEATEKYFKDYEKSLNPAGLGAEEVKIFANKLKQVQEFGLKNKQAINNPSKYGYDSQSELMAGFKDLQTFIEESKKATAERKALVDFFNQNKKSGKRVSDDYLEVYKNAFLPVGAGYVSPDYSKIAVYDPHDDLTFIDKTWKGIDLPGKIEIEEQVLNKKPTGRVKEVKVESITPDVANNYAQRARSYYRSNLGTQEQYNDLIKDKDFVSQLNPTYKKNFGVDIKTPEDLVVAYGLATKQPKREDRTGYDFTKEWYFREGQKRQDIRSAKNKQGTDEDPVDTYLTDARSGKTFAGREGENIEVMNLPEIITKDLGKERRAAVVGRGIGDGEYYNIVYQKDNKGNPTDLIDWGKTEKIPSSQIRSIIVARALPSSAKAKLIGGSGVKVEKAAQKEASSSTKEVKETKTFVFPKGKTKF